LKSFHFDFLRMTELVGATSKVWEHFRFSAKDHKFIEPDKIHAGVDLRVGFSTIKKLGSTADGDYMYCH